MELELNEKILSDFGELLHPDWNNKETFFIPPHRYNKKGTLFASFSTTVTARGELARTRIQFLEIDDYEDYSTSINPNISQLKFDILQRDFLPSLAEDGCAVMLGNNARTTCIFNILKTLPEKERKEKYPFLELYFIPAWDEKNNKPTWHERYNYNSEDEMRLAFGVSRSVWDAEYQQKPSPPEGSRFLLRDWTIYDTLPKDARGVMICDPAIGETHDYKAVALLFFSPSTRRFYSPDCFCRRCGWEEYFLGMYSLYERYKNHIAYIGWESNFHQAQFLDFQRLFQSTANRPRLPIRKFNVEGKKEWRIEKLETPYSMHDILFAKSFTQSKDGIEAQAQLISYGSGGHDDYPDALASAYNLVWSMAQSAISSQPAYYSGDKRKYAERF
jgi:hypothetical protein